MKVKHEIQVNSKLSLCRFGWHDWDKWNDLSDGLIAENFIGGQTVLILQEKRCKKCNKVKRKFIST